MEKKTVRYMVFPDITNGVSGFYEHALGQSQKCAEPNKTYKSGVCHTVGGELDELAIQAGFETREQFAAGYSSEYWKNAYGKELSLFVGKMLEAEGVILDIEGADVLFRCPKNEFVPWEYGKSSN